MAEVDGQLTDDFEARPQGLASFLCFSTSLLESCALKEEELQDSSKTNINDSTMLRKILKSIKKMLAKGMAFL